MSILRMTDSGRALFISYLDGLKTGQPTEFPQVLLEPSTHTEVIGGDTVMLDRLDLGDRLATAIGLDEIVRSIGLSSAERDWGFWAWCSAYLFGRICNKKNSKYVPGEVSVWIPEPTNYKRYYRHYLVSIWQVYVTHREKSEELKVLLSGPVNKPGELWGQIAATQTLITNPSMIDAVYRLYWDKENQKRKFGAGGKSPRRFTQVLKQFGRTYDFFAMSGDQIVDLMPAEFDRFK